MKALSSLLGGNNTTQIMMDLQKAQKEKQPCLVKLFQFLSWPDCEYQEILIAELIGGQKFGRQNELGSSELCFLGE